MKCMQFSDVQNEPFIYCLYHLMKVQFVFFLNLKTLNMKYIGLIIDYQYVCLNVYALCDYIVIFQLRLCVLGVCHYSSTLKCHLPFALLCTFAFNMYLTGFKGIVWSCKDNRPRKQLVPQTKAIVTKCFCH